MNPRINGPHIVDEIGLLDGSAPRAAHNALPAPTIRQNTWPDDVVGRLRAMLDGDDSVPIFETIEAAIEALGKCLEALEGSRRALSAVAGFPKGAAPSEAAIQLVNEAMQATDDLLTQIRKVQSND